MKTFLTLAVLSTLGLASQPAQAGFYFEGLTPFVEAPNCNDPYATRCGRDNAHHPHHMKEHAKPDHKAHGHHGAKAPHKGMKVRTKTRSDLEK